MIFYGANAIFHFTFMNAVMTTVTVALMNTLFRLATLLVLMPAIPLMEKLVIWLIPEKGNELLEQHDMDRLEERFLQHPALAIEQSRLVTGSMAEKARDNLLRAMHLRKEYSERGFEQVDEVEQLIDRYEDKLGTYLMKLTARSLSPEQTEEVAKYLHTISDFERISDHACNVADVCQEIDEKKIEFSKSASHELQVLEGAVTEILAISIEAFTGGNLQLAARVEPLEEIIDGLCDEMKSHHVDRLQQGLCTLNQGFVFNDLLTNYERVADHCSNIAVAVIEVESDSFDTHEYLNSVKAVKDASFARFYDEYKQKYSI